MGSTDWAPGVAVLLLGLSVGAVMAWRALRIGRRTGAPLALTPDGRTLTDLMDRRQTLLERLRAMMASSEEPTAPATRERLRTEVQAAKVLQEIDERKSARRAHEAGQPSKSVRLHKKAKKKAKRSELRSVLLGMWAGATVVGLFFMVREGLAPKAPEVGQMPPMMAMPASSGTAADEAAPASGAPELRGTIALDPSLAGKVAKDATVFVTVRASGQRRGPPIAAKKLTASSFPVEFALGPADSMMGMPFPDKAAIEARVDFDGNPMTRDPNEPSAVLDPVSKGATDLKLVLKAARPDTN